MLWSFLILSLVAESGLSQRCRDFGAQVDNLLADQKISQAKISDLEEKLKSVLQQEITAQVEKQDTSEAEKTATMVFYELRKSKIERDRWAKMLTALRERDCETCSKEEGFQNNEKRLCQLCPQNKICQNRGPK